MLCTTPLTVVHHHQLHRGRPVTAEAPKKESTAPSSPGRVISSSSPSSSASRRSQAGGMFLQHELLLQTAPTTTAASYVPSPPKQPKHSLLFHQTHPPSEGKQSRPTSPTTSSSAGTMSSKHDVDDGCVSAAPATLSSRPDRSSGPVVPDVVRHAPPPTPPALVLLASHPTQSPQAFHQLCSDRCGPEVDEKVAKGSEEVLLFSNAPLFATRHCCETATQEADRSAPQPQFPLTPLSSPRNEPLPPPPRCAGSSPSTATTTTNRYCVTPSTTISKCDEHDEGDADASSDQEHQPYLQTEPQRALPLPLDTIPTVSSFGVTASDSVGVLGGTMMMMGWGSESVRSQATAAAAGGGGGGGSDIAMSSSGIMGEHSLLQHACAMGSNRTSNSGGGGGGGFGSRQTSSFFLPSFQNDEDSDTEEAQLEVASRHHAKPAKSGAPPVLPPPPPPPAPTSPTTSQQRSVATPHHPHTHSHPPHASAAFTSKATAALSRLSSAAFLSVKVHPPHQNPLASILQQQQPLYPLSNEVVQQHHHQPIGSSSPFATKVSDNLVAVSPPSLVTWVPTTTTTYLNSPPLQAPLPLNAAPSSHTARGLRGTPGSATYFRSSSSFQSQGGGSGEFGSGSGSGSGSISSSHPPPPQHSPQPAPPLLGVGYHGSPRQHSVVAGGGAGLSSASSRALSFQQELIREGGCGGGGAPTASTSNSATGLSSSGSSWQPFPVTGGGSCPPLSSSYRNRVPEKNGTSSVPSSSAPFLNSNNGNNNQINARRSVASNAAPQPQSQQSRQPSVRKVPRILTEEEECVLREYLQK